MKASVTNNLFDSNLDEVLQKEFSLKFKCFPWNSVTSSSPLAKPHLFVCFDEGELI